MFSAMCQAFVSAVLTVVVTVIIVALAIVGIHEGAAWGLIFPAPLAACVLLKKTWVSSLYYRYDSASVHFGNYSEESRRTFIAWRLAEVGTMLTTVAAYVLIAYLKAK